MLNTILPFTIVHSAIDVDTFSIPLNCVVLESTGEYFTVGPFVVSSAVHFVVWPLTGVLTAICPILRSSTLYHIILPVTIICVTVEPSDHSFAMFHTLNEIPFILRAIRVGFNSMTLLNILKPFTFILLTGVFVDIYTKAVTLVVDECAFVLITIQMNVCALTLLYAIYPHPGVAWAIFESHSPLPMHYLLSLILSVFLDLSGVFSSIIDAYFFYLLFHHTWVLKLIESIFLLRFCRSSPISLWFLA